MGSIEKKKMSVAIPIASLQDKDIETMEKKLQIELVPKQRGAKAKPMWKPPEKVAVFRKEGDQVMVPFRWGASYFGKDRRRPRQECELLHSRFQGVLRAEQKQIFQESIALLNQSGSCLMAIYPGGGKTITSLAIASAVGLRTMIFVNKIVLIDQWLDTLYKWFGKDVSVHVIQGKKKALVPDADFYIANAVNIMKHPFEEYKKLGIGMLIVDECHLMVTRIFSQALSYICPRYLMGLSATPFRVDGFDILLELYFGLHKVIRKLYRPHTVYYIDSGIRIDHDKDSRGDIIWNSVIDKQASHEERNVRITDICRRYKDRNILVLCKRVKQMETITGLLRSQEENATMMKDNDSTFDRDARVLIATFQKVGTGFSHEKLDMLILASDAEEYFIQYLGRVFRRPDVEPIIIDIVDKHPILKKHFNSRRRIYEECGGRIQTSSV